MESHMIPLNAPLGDDSAGGTIVVTMPTHPPDYIVWSVASLFYGNPCCLGMIAFYFSVKSRDHKLLGDMDGAKSYGSRACYVNSCALVFILIFIVYLIVMVITKRSAFLYSQYGGYF